MEAFQMSPGQIGWERTEVISACSSPPWKPSQGVNIAARVLRKAVLAYPLQGMLGLEAESRASISCCKFTLCRSLEEPRTWSVTKLTQVVSSRKRRLGELQALGRPGVSFLPAPAAAQTFSSERETQSAAVVHSSSPRQLPADLQCVFRVGSIAGTLVRRCKHSALPWRVRG